MSHHSPYANSNNIHEFSIKRGIKSILRSLKGKNNTLSSRVSVGDSTAGGSSNASGGSGTSIHTHSKPSAALASVGSYDTSERVRYNGRIRQSSDIVMTPREVIDSHRVTGRAESSPQGRHNQGPRSSLKDILGSQNSPDYPHGGVSVVYPKVRQIDVKPSPDASAKDLVCDKVRCNIFSAHYFILYNLLFSVTASMRQRGVRTSRRIERSTQMPSGETRSLAV